MSDEERTGKRRGEVHYLMYLGKRCFSVGSVVKKQPVMWETWVLFLGHEDPSGEGNGNPLQYSCLGHPMDRVAWWVAVHEVTEELDMTATKQQQQQH